MRIGLTYDDVLLVPKRTPLKSRKEANTKTKFTKNISLNIPLVSSNMASVTEHKMAISMARKGGLGIIHQFNDVLKQVEEVKLVKKSTSYVIDTPLTTNKNIKLKDAIKCMNKEHISSMLVVNKEKLIGILTKRDYSLETNLNKKVYEVMTPKNKLITARYGISLEKARTILNKHKIEKLPLIKDGHLKGLITRQDIWKLDKWSDACRDKKGRLLVGAAIGVKDALKRAQALIKSGVDVLVLDIAHCHSDYAITKLKELKKKFKIDIMAGNIATAAAAKDLIKAGADGLKVGIGPSPVCSTREISGGGVPQLTAIIDVCSVAKTYDIPITADGGLKTPGDIVKAIAAGANTIYSGSFFAGTDESPGFVINIDGKRYKRYMGSASYDNNHERNEKLNNRKSNKKMNVFVEGVSTLTDYKGSVEEVITSLMKGFCSGISYCGAKNIPEMQKNAEFIKITSASLKESKAVSNKFK